MGNNNEEISTSLDILKIEFNNLENQQIILEKSVNALIEGFGVIKD